jgi:putative ubiquitin-RnfH superfamily antitoxin RatB of RatAB toxin-antitoxin module
MASTAADKSIRIELVFASPDRQELLALEVDRHSTVADVIRNSPLSGLFAEQDFAACEVGIWGRLVDRGQQVTDGDRVEIYRPLAIDPREARRRLATQGRSMGQTK